MIRKTVKVKDWASAQQRPVRRHLLCWESTELTHCDSLPYVRLGKNNTNFLLRYKSLYPFLLKFLSSFKDKYCTYKMLATFGKLFYSRLNTPSTLFFNISKKENSACLGAKLSLFPYVPLLLVIPSWLSYYYMI